MAQLPVPEQLDMEATSAVNELEQFEKVSNSIELLILRTLKKISVSNFTNFELLNFELRTLNSSIEL